MLAGCRITGWDTNHYATPTMLTQSNMRPRFGGPNWVGGILPFFGIDRFVVFGLAFACSFSRVCGGAF